MMSLALFTVAQEAVASAGVPAQGIMGMSEAMAPQSAASDGIGTIMPQSMRQAVPDTPAVPMRKGGTVVSRSQSGNMTDDEYEKFMSDLSSSSLFNKGMSDKDAFNRAMSLLEEDLSGYSSGGSTGQRIEERRMKNGKIGLFQGNTFLGTKQDRDGNGESLADQIGFGGDGNIMDSIKEALGFAEGGVIKAQNGLPLGLRQSNPGNMTSRMSKPDDAQDIQGGDGGESAGGEKVQPRLFAYPSLEELTVFDSDDLDTDCCFILHSGDLEPSETLFVWIGEGFADEMGIDEDDEDESVVERNVT